MADLNLYDVTLGEFQTKNLSSALPNGIGTAWSQFDPRARAAQADTLSIFHNAKYGATLHSDVMMAAACLCDPTFMMTWRPESGIVKVTNEMYLVEYHHLCGETTFVEYHYDTGGVRALVATDPSGRVRTSMQTLSSKIKQNCLPIFLAILSGMYDHIPEVRSDLDEVAKQISAGTLTSDACNKALFRVCDAVYYGLKDGHVALDLTKDGNLPKIADSDIYNISYDDGQVIAGNPVVLLTTGSTPSRTNTKKAKPKTTMGEFKTLDYIRDYVAKHCSHWTEAEKELIPQFPDKTKVAPEVIECATVIAQSADKKRPVVNLAWRGTSGFGKSTGVEMLACLLNKPLLRITCFSTMEQQNFLSSIMPDTTKHTPGLSVTFDEIACDPEGTYERLTGEYKEGISCNEVFMEAAKQMAASANNTPRYVMQESNYVKALKNGYIIEVQESSRIRDAGVLPGLNEYDRPGAMIPQVDGTFVKRHPDAIVFYTDNVGYNSCNELDPSVIRRIAYVIDSTDLTKKDMVDRIMRNTGVKDKLMVESMYEVWYKVQKYCKDNDLLSAGGCVTIEELERWVQMYDLYDFDTKMVRTLCERCVVSKATTDYDEQKAILTGVVDPELSKQRLVS